MKKDMSVGIDEPRHCHLAPKIYIIWAEFFDIGAGSLLDGHDTAGLGVHCNRDILGEGFSFRVKQC